MVARFEKSGDLLFYRRVSADSEEMEWQSSRLRKGVWLAVLVVTAGVLFLAPHVLAAGHAQTFLGSGLMR